MSHNRKAYDFTADVTDWRIKAACRNHPDPDVFFPAGRTGTYLLTAQRAKDFCRPCPVRGACLDWALTHPHLTAHGVWGGTDPDQRKRFKRIQ